MTDQLNYSQIGAGVYQACTAYDQYMPQLSAEVATAWGRTFEHYRLSVQDLLAAVDRVYATAKPGYRPLPNDIAQAAREIRRERSDEQVVREIREATAIANKRRMEELTAGLGDPNYTRASQQHGINPLSVECPYQACRAKVGYVCVNTSFPGGKPRKDPHPGRIDAAAAAARDAS